MTSTNKALRDELDRMHDAITDRDLRLIRASAFVEGILPEKADHGTPYNGYVGCSATENGHKVGDCPQDLADDDEAYGVPVGEIRELLAVLKGAVPA